MRPMQSPEDIEAERVLLRAMRQGNHRAFDTLYTRYYDMLCRDTARIVHSPDIAEDLVQEVFTTLWIQRERVQVRRSVRGYLFAAARNRARDWMDHQVVEARAADRPVEEFLDILPNASTPADQQVTLAELTQAIEDGFATLAPRSRDALRLVTNQATGQMVSEQLGVGLSTARTLVWRGRWGMRRFLMAAGWTELPAIPVYHGKGISQPVAPLVGDVTVRPTPPRCVPPSPPPRTHATAAASAVTRHALPRRTPRLLRIPTSRS